MDEWLTAARGGSRDELGMPLGNGGVYEQNDEDTARLTKLKWENTTN